MRLHFREYGSGDPLIVLHGLFGSGDNWHTLAQSLAERYRVFTVDLRNHGKSPHSPEFTYEVMARDVAELMEALDLQAARLLGHSMGGKVAMELALSRGASVGALVVVDISPRRYEPHNVELRDALLSIDPARLPSRKDAERALAALVPDRTVQLFLLKNLVRGDDGAFRWQLDLQSIASSFDEIWTEIDGERSYRGPALFVRGALSDYVDESDLPRIRRLFPSATLATVEGAGHWVQADRPEELLGIVEDFLSREVSRAT